MCQLYLPSTSYSLDISLLLHTPWILLIDKAELFYFQLQIYAAEKKKKNAKIVISKKSFVMFCCGIIFPYLVKPGAGILCWWTSPWKVKNQFIWKNLNFQKIILDFNSNKLKSINVLNIYALYNLKGRRHLKVIYFSGNRSFLA